MGFLPRQEVAREVSYAHEQGIGKSSPHSRPIQPLGT